MMLIKAFSSTVRATRALAAVALLAIAGCTAAPSEPATGPSTSRDVEAPAIDIAPLDASGFIDSPCTLVPMRALRPIPIVTAGVGEPLPHGTMCVWSSQEPQNVPNVRVLVRADQPGGWSWLYDTQDRWQLFEAAEDVRDYPAVHVGDDQDLRHGGTCTTIVGINTDTPLQVRVQLAVRAGTAPFPLACAEADRLAEAAIVTLQQSTS